jgi:hypothetical protein
MLWDSDRPGRSLVCESGGLRDSFQSRFRERRSVPENKQQRPKHVQAMEQPFDGGGGEADGMGGAGEFTNAWVLPHESDAISNLKSDLKAL